MRKTCERRKVVGLVMVAVGVGVMAFLATVEREEPIFLVGIIPTLVGVALLTHAFLLAPKEPAH